MKQLFLGVALTLVVPVCIAAPGANPISKAQADALINGLQIQIDAIKNNPSGSTHYIGECYGGGIVYYVNTTPGAPAGQQGLIVALADAGGSGTTYAYDTNPPSNVVAPSKTYFTGKANTDAITGEISTQAAAATAAAAYPASAGTCTTCTAWYLPAQDELSTLYSQSTTSGASFWTACSGGVAPAGQPYWSSTQNDTGNAWFVDFSVGLVSATSTTNTFGVRPVRAF